MLKYKVGYKVHLNLKRFTELHKEYIRRALEEGGALIEADAKRKCRVDLGTLRDSIFVKVEDWDKVWVGTSQVSYAAAVEWGSAPHAPPFKPIQEWAERHGIKNWRGVWWKIYHHGTQPHPFMRPAVHENKINIMELLRKATVKAAQGARRHTP